MSLLTLPSLSTGSGISATVGSTTETDFLECQVDDQKLRPSGVVTDQILSVCSEAKDNCALLGYYAVCSGNSLLMLCDNIVVPLSMVKKMGLIGCPETLVRTYHYMLCNSPKQQFSSASLRKLEIWSEAVPELQ